MMCIYIVEELFLTPILAVTLWRSVMCRNKGCIFAHSRTFVS